MINNNNHHSNISLDNDQHQALQAMLSGQNVFLSGEAGTGKSVVIREFERLCSKQLVKLAPTGIAARNINGSTIHGFFKFSAGIQDEEQKFSWNRKLYDLLHTVDVIIVDEISMVRSDLFQAMDSVLRDVMRTDMAFGGKQLVVVGDFCQLPPVVEKYEIENYIRNRFGGIFAFQTHAWANARFETIMLETIHRQDDTDFLDLLNDVRHGISSYWGIRIIGRKVLKEDYTISDRIGVFEDINELCYTSPSFNNGNDFEIDNLHNGTLAVCCTKNNVRMINKLCMDRLDDPGMRCSAVKFGSFPYDELPTEMELHIKRGERVMLLNNQPAGDGYQHVNGDLGTVVDYYDDGVNPIVKVELDDGRTVSVKRVPWKHLEYSVVMEDGDEPYIIQEETGTFWQLPLAPAYAITIHKAQGQTINRMHLVLDKGCFAEGQLYTALSRVRSMDDLTLDRHIHDSDLIFDYDVHDFYGYGIPDERD